MRVVVLRERSELFDISNVIVELVVGDGAAEGVGPEEVVKDGGAGGVDEEFLFGGAGEGLGDGLGGGEVVCVGGI